MDEGDPFNLERFIQAQSGGVYEQALAELHAGKKRSHWMWFIFPQHVDLGRSPTAKYYGLSGEDEAAAYLGHALLEQRLIACCDVLLTHMLNGTAARDVLGDLDAMKLRSSMAIFHAAEEEEYRFREVLQLAREPNG